jgi:ABC-type cobalt transport system substrate-binding protein
LRKEVKQVKKEVSPMVIGIVMGVVLIVVIIIGFRTFGGSSKMDTTESKEHIEKVQSGQPLYQPPPGVVPGAPSGNAGGGGSVGGYNLTPPPGSPN